jgi:hypothetical protein
MQIEGVKQSIQTLPMTFRGLAQLREIANSTARSSRKRILGQDKEFTSPLRDYERASLRSPLLVDN